MPTVPIVYFAIATGLVWLMFLVMAAIRACTGDYNPPAPEVHLPEIKLDKEVTCSVCLDVVTVEHQARQLECHHAFHSKCISGWLLHGANKHWDDNSIQCPVCRQRQLLPKLPGMNPVVVGASDGSVEMAA
ncbi:SIRP1 [Symbiodinium microadriaticum]|nr:SIRP1 [Symbiodinium sp. KB8]CAE7226425.1 SIRP1 [Symbiodinium microadriaticum]|eukprot:CAMPEP_0181413268 /NCGR_PEP_ID=MMETSP1110-20121109/8882_1 /TAXON_ID=174948 /ORGANISM="Symbiodinium sp., Strain CCMP421" /LENGTH=130 /DNA_ID=CAMNT_0023536071 /DNA_START=29 /DNA_END=421 /DNA_ORIENTATION=-